jgi:hypothetical protein
MLEAGVNPWRSSRRMRVLKELRWRWRFSARLRLGFPTSARRKLRVGAPEGFCGAMPSMRSMSDVVNMVSSFCLCAISWWHVTCLGDVARQNVPQNWAQCDVMRQWDCVACDAHHCRETNGRASCPSPASGWLGRRQAMRDGTPQGCRIGTLCLCIARKASVSRRGGACGHRLLRRCLMFVHAWNASARNAETCPAPSIAWPYRSTLRP